MHNPATIKAHPNGKEHLVVDGKVIPDTSATLEDAWKVMEAQVDAGRAKAIGLSNFSLAQVERIVKIARILPANHQVELNATYPKKALRELSQKYGITICAFAPLGSPGRKEYYASSGSDKKVLIPTLLENPDVVKIADRLNVTPAQVLLRFLAQQGVVVIPKSVTPARIISNFKIFDFNLEPEDMAKLDALDSGKEGSWGFDWNNGFPGIKDHPEFQLEINSVA
jgi:aldehyde reductase